MSLMKDSLLFEASHTNLSASVLLELKRFRSSEGEHHKYNEFTY